MYSTMYSSSRTSTIVYSSSGSRDSIGGVYYVCTIVYSIEAIIIMYNVQQTGAYIYDHVVLEEVRITRVASYYYYTTTTTPLLI